MSPPPPLWEGGSSKFDGGQLKSKHEGSMENAWESACERVNLIVELAAISLKACKFTKFELLHTYLSRILATF